MNELSTEMIARSRNIQAVVLHRLAQVKQVNVSKKAGVSESTVSRFMSDHLELTSKVLAALSLKIVSTDEQVISTEQKRVLMQIARDHFDTELAREERLSE